MSLARSAELGKLIEVSHLQLPGPGLVRVGR